VRRALKLDGTWHQTGLSLAFLRRSGSRLRRQAALYLFGKKSHIIDIEAAIQVFHKITPYYKGCHSLLRVAPSPQLRLTTCSQRVSSPKSYEHNPSPAKQVSLGEPHTSIPLVPKGLLFPKKQVATALGAYKVLLVYGMGCHQLLGLLGNRQKGVLKDRTGSAGRNSCWGSSSALKRTQAQSVRGGLRTQRPRKLLTIDAGSLSSNSSSY